VAKGGYFPREGIIGYRNFIGPNRGSIPIPDLTFTSSLKFGLRVRLKKNFRGSSWVGVPS